MSKSFLQSSERVVVSGVFSLLVCAFALRQLESTDFWWQLHLGRYIWSTQSVPTTDLFTLTAKGNHYIDSHWLFQVGLWALYKIAGINGVILSVAAVALATWGCVAATVDQAGRRGLGLLVLAVGAVAASERYVPRPDLVSIALLAVVHLIVLRYRRNGGRLVWLLPAIALFWVNTHGLWILGPIVVAGYAVGDALLHKLPVPDDWREHAMPLDRVRSLGVVFLGMVIVAFCTPQPLAQALYPFTLFREISSASDFVASSVTEVASPFTHPHWSVSTWAYLVLVVGTCLAALSNVRRLDVPGLLLSVAFAYLGFTARRNIPLFAVLVAPVVIRHLPVVANARLQAAGTWASACLAVAFSWGAATNRVAEYEGTLTRFGLGLHRAMSPVDLARHIPTELTGNIWNTPTFGGYMLWRFWPEREPVIDGRWEIYDPAFLSMYGESLQDQELWEQFADENDIRAAVITHRRPDYAMLLRRLHQSPAWVPVYVDSYGAIYARNAPEILALFQGGPAPEAPVERLGFAGLETLLATFPPRPADPTKSELLGNYYYLLQTPEADAQAVNWFTHALQISPRSYISHLSLGTLLLESGSLEQSEQHFETAIQLRPWAVDGWLGLAEIRTKLGDSQGAASALEKAQRIAPTHPRIDVIGS